jgi:hypothetical protein
VARSRRELGREFAQAQARDRRTLPGVPRLLRPGPYGTFAGETFGSAPDAPTLDDGPLYTGESREEVDGKFQDVPDENDAPFTFLASLRRPWPYVGFVIDTSQVPATFQIVCGLVLLTRSGPARLIGNVVGPAPTVIPEIELTTPIIPFPMVGMAGIYAGERVAVWVKQTGGDHPATVQMRANLWGYNAPGFGP